MRSILPVMYLAALLVVTAPCAGATGSRSLSSAIDLGDIPARPSAPEFAFDRFFQTRPFGQFAFAADDRSIYFLKSDGRVDSIFNMDLSGRSVLQLTHLSESVSGFLLDHRGRFLIIVQDVEGNENYDLYRFDLQSGELLRLTAAGSGDTTMVCGLSPDDTLLYYAQTRDQRREAGLWQLEISTGKLRQLLPGK
jgi:Tol biopolymer transport system component